MFIIKRIRNGYLRSHENGFLEGSILPNSILCCYFTAFSSKYVNTKSFDVLTQCTLRTDNYVTITSEIVTS